MSTILDIFTNNEHYKVTRSGCIERVHPHVLPSLNWRLLGITRLNNFGHPVEQFLTDDLFAGRIPEKLRHKNGKPSWRLWWMDHGHMSISMNDAIHSIAVREVVEADGSK